MGKAADLIFEARRRAGVSQAEFARRVGVSRPTLNAYERGRREPGVDALERLLEAAGLRLVTAPALRVPDPQAAANALEDLLGLVDAIAPRGPRRPLLFPAVVKR
jgi:transcriptional regulator with XRE-family HTH domain